MNKLIIDAAITGDKTQFIRLPTRKSELPTTRRGLIDLARVLRSLGFVVRIYEGENFYKIRARFIMRLGLIGRGTD